MTPEEKKRYHNEYQKAYYKNNKDYYREWRENNQDKVVISLLRYHLNKALSMGLITAQDHQTVRDIIGL